MKIDSQIDSEKNAHAVMISYSQALELIKNACNDFGTQSQKVVFSESLGRILAQDIFAPFDVPALATSAMDGFAINFDDFENLNAGLALDSVKNSAGLSSVPPLQKNSAMRTYTGSAMPQNSDTIILVEDVEIFERDGVQFVRLNERGKSFAYTRGAWVRQVGDNYKKGELLLKKGTKISAYEIGLLAEINCVFVQVRQKLKIGILCVGDEILEVGSSGAQNKVRSVNNHALSALVRTLGQESIMYENACDDMAALERQYLRALGECDVLLTAGGMSVGDFDFTKDVMKKHTNLVFKGVRMKPGKPVAFGIFERKFQNLDSKTCFVFGLPGFPNSCLATFHLFARVLILGLLGADSQNLILNATLSEDVKRKDARAEFRVCDVKIIDGEIFASFESKKSLQSSMINNLCAGSAFAILDENGSDLPKGAKIKVMLFRDLN